MKSRERRRCPLPALIGVDESPVGYSLAGCAPAEHRLRFTDREQNALKWSCPSIDFQRTANSVLTVCVSQGDNPSSPVTNPN